MVRPISAIVSKSTLRDVMNRLRKMRQACGVEDEAAEAKTSGDPFRDKILAFQKSAKQIREMIQERNDEAQKGKAASTDIAQKSHDINVELRNLNAELKAIEALTEAAVRDVARTNKKMAKGKDDQERSEKLKARERVAKEREQAQMTCRQVVEDLKDLNQQRFLTAKEAREMKDAGPGAKKAGPKMRQTLAERMQNNRRRQAKGEEGGEEMDGDAPKKSGRLEDDPETKEQMKELALKKQKEDAALTRIQAGLGRITEVALRIGEELDQQDKMLQDAEDKADKATKDLKTINKALNKMLKDQKPMNVLINVICVVLILGLLGFFLTEFGAI